VGVPVDPVVLSTTVPSSAISISGLKLSPK
jgi:hypothetical protein